MSNLQISLCQIDIELCNTHANLEKICALVEKEAAQGSQLIAFPECALTGYICNSEKEALDTALEIDSPEISTLRRLCERNAVYIVVGFAGSQSGNLYNCAATIGPGNYLNVYRKTHIPLLGFDRFVEPGEHGFVVQDLPLGRVGVMICYDQSFPESARVLNLKGAQLIILITNWPEGSFAPQMVATRAFENNVFYAAVNRVGDERGFRFAGKSAVVAPNGDILQRAKPQSEQVLRQKLDLSLADLKKRVVVPGEYETDLVGHRRPEFYSQLSKIEPDVDR